VRTEQLAPFGKTLGIPFLLLSVALGSATVGWFNRRRWGMAVVFIIATKLWETSSTFCWDVLLRVA